MEVIILNQLTRSGFPPVYRSFWRSYPLQQRRTGGLQLFLWGVAPMVRSASRWPWCSGVQGRL